MKLSLVSLAALSLLSLQGCAEKGNHYTVVISPIFSTEEQDLIIGGVQKWVDSTHESAHPLSVDYKIGENVCAGKEGYITGGAWHTVCFVTSTVQQDIDLGSSHGNLGVTFYTSALDSSTVRLALDNAGLSSDAVNYQGNFQSVVAHEFGHALGLVHHQGKVLMNPLLQNSADITTDDLEQFERTF